MNRLKDVVRTLPRIKLEHIKKDVNPETSSARPIPKAKIKNWVLLDDVSQNLVD